MNVFIADKFETVGIDELKKDGHEVHYTPGLSGDALAEAVNKTRSDVLIVRSTKVPAPIIDAAKELKLIVRAGAGVDTIDVNAATKRGIKVANCPGLNSVAVAELTLGLIISLDRRIVDETNDLRQRVWNKKEYSKARGLKDRTIGIIGMGRIGQEVAKRAFAFDMKILYMDVIARPEIEKNFKARQVELDELLKTSDFVTIHVPGGAETHHLIDAKKLALMKTTAFILNCARGGVIDETALAEAVKGGRIAGAALDVFEVEPAANDTEFKDPVVTVPHVYGTHHVGASTEQAQTAIAFETARIIKTFKQTGKAINCVNG